MNLDKLNRWMTLGANLGVLAGMHCPTDIESAPQQHSALLPHSLGPKDHSDPSHGSTFKMPLSIIGSGFGRTGTMSLKLALEQLGLGPCHHMEEVMDNAEEQFPHWRAAARGEAVDWDDVYHGYQSTVDWPGAHYWRELAECYPDAKVIHTLRPAEEWWESYSKTIAVILAEAGSGDSEREVRSIPEMAYAIVADQTFGGRCDDKSAAIGALEKRTEDVKETIAPDRLLLFQVSDGWEPLCDFLDVPVPATPFPRSNDSAAFWEKFGALG